MGEVLRFPSKRRQKPGIAMEHADGFGHILVLPVVRIEHHDCPPPPLLTADPPQKGGNRPKRRRKSA